MSEEAVYPDTGCQHVRLRLDEGELIILEVEVVAPFASAEAMCRGVVVAATQHRGYRICFLNAFAYDPVEDISRAVDLQFVELVLPCQLGFREGDLLC